MFNKEYFVAKENDLEIFTNEFEKYKEWFLNYIKENKGITVKKFLEDDQLNSKSPDNTNIGNKYFLLSSIKQSDKVNEIYKEINKIYNDFYSPLGQNKEYFDFIKSLIPENKLEEEIKYRYLKMCENSGFSLPEADQKRLNEIKEELNLKSVDFNENIVKSKKDWKFKIDEKLKEELSDLELKYCTELNGELFLSYNQGAFQDILTKSNSEKLRKVVYEAMKYPASEKSNYNNKETTNKILSLKKEYAKILGHKRYTDLALDRRMASSYEEISSFLNKIKDKVKPLAKKESKSLDDFVLNEFKISNLQKWDRAFYEAIKKEKTLNYKYKMECEYFPEEKVFKGVFDLVTKLFGFTFILDKESFILPYEDTLCFRVYEKDKLKAYLIVDMYERDAKDYGAWVSCLEPVMKDEPGLISLCCTVNKKEVGLKIDDINTFLHEMGHAIHHFSSESEYSSFSGTNGFARDAVEIPSQMLEQFSYNKKFLKEISCHYKTEDKISDSMLDILISLKNYNIGSHYSRQLVFALYDLNLYHDFTGDIFDYYKKVANEILPLNVDEDTNFPNTFSHIFSGGYSAGYYGYMWADVYSIDAYLHILNDEISNANKFKEEFLRKGSSVSPKNLYLNFKEKDVNIDDFFSYYGV